MGRVFFDAEDIKDRFAKADFDKIERLDEASGPLLVQGTMIYSDDANRPTELEQIHHAKLYGERKITTLSGDKHRLYINDNDRFGNLPHWLDGVAVHCEESGEYIAHVDLNGTICTTRYVKDGELITEYDVRCNDPIAARAFRRFFHQLSHAKRCQKCGKILTAANGEIDLDPTRTTCLWECDVDTMAKITA